MKNSIILLLFSIFFTSYTPVMANNNKPFNKFDYIINSLSLPEGFHISVYCYGLYSPWMMTLDRDDNLLVTIPERGAVVGLPDRNNDNKADEVRNIKLNLSYPTGITFLNNELYIGTIPRIIKSSYNSNKMEIKNEKWIYTSLPSLSQAPKYRTLKPSIDGKLLITLGTPCDACLPSSVKLGSIIQINNEGSDELVYASGMHSPIGLAHNPNDMTLWNTDISREGLNNVPDEVNIITQNKHYGWPFCYDDNIQSPEFSNNSYCGSSVKPTIKLPDGSSPHGLAFNPGGNFPNDYQGDLFIALHGEDGNKNGFKIVRVLFYRNKPFKIKDFITGWLTKDNIISGRPVDIIFNSKGEMFISDNHAGLIYKVVYNGDKK